MEHRRYYMETEDHMRRYLKALRLQIHSGLEKGSGWAQAVEVLRRSAAETGVTSKRGEAQHLCMCLREALEILEQRDIL